MSEQQEHVVYEHEGMALHYQRGERGLGQIAVCPQGTEIDPTRTMAYPNFVLGIAGRPYGFMAATVAGYADLPLRMEMVAHERSADALTFRYRDADTGLVVDVRQECIPGVAIVRQWTSVVNEGKVPVTLTQFSSTILQGIAPAGRLPWYDPRKVRVHYCLQAWEGEGQWREASLQDLGVYPTSVHPCGTAFHVSSIGSWSTARYLPMVVLEDLEAGQVWYLQIETSSNWHYEIGYRSSWTDERGGLFLHADGASELHGGWYKELAPGERFDAVPVAVGCCAGGFGEAVRELTRHRRSTLKPAPAWKGEAPVFFNDYMNCLWGNPTGDKLLPLIDAAAQVGAEGFCIDAGWFGGASESWGTGLGDWQPSQNRFGPEGLQGVLDYIRAKGMLPGVWLEMEVCSENSLLGQRPDSWFLMRHGQRVGGGTRWFLNFCNPQVREYLHGVLDRLVAMGVRYIKNDYNESTGPGDDQLGTSAPDGLLANARAFYDFLDEVRARQPELILENCGSGAMRQDYGILSHMHLQSSSDQEIYTLYPATIAGGLAGVLPEQYGIWSYPWPLLFAAKDQPELLTSDSYRQAMEDGEQTIFNMVNGLCGNLYLSGRIDLADAHNLALVAEGLTLYKRERAHIHRAHPVWPLGQTRFRDLDTWVSVGLASEDERRVLLAVWRLSSAVEHCTLPIPSWQGSKAQVRQLYPLAEPHVPLSYQQETGSVTVHLPKVNQARFLELEREG